MFEPRNPFDPASLPRPVLKAALGMLNGLRWVMDPTPEVDRTPRQEVLAHGKLRLMRFESEARRHPVPLLLLPPLMVKPYVFDLHPRHSMVAHLLGAGYDVFLLDYGTPGPGDEEVQLAHYVYDYLPAAIQAMQQQTGQAQVTPVGYCLGGLFALLYTAAFQSTVRNLVLLSCPIDFSRMGVISVAAQLAHRQAGELVDQIGNIPGILPAVAMRLADPMKELSRNIDIFVNLWDDEYVSRHRSLSTWLNDFIPGPRDAYKEYLERFVHGNDLKDGKITLAGRNLDMRDIRVPLLAVTGNSDHIATKGASKHIVRLVGSTDKTFTVVPGGHVGAIAGGSADRHLWKKLAGWLETRSA
ncbi:MAG: alpha/beta fold hydrolase [Candidatus Xenobia bacterium]